MQDINSERDTRDNDKQDARDFAEFIKDARREGFFNSLIGVALSSYMNGVSDTCRSFKAAQNAV